MPLKQALEEGVLREPHLLDSVPDPPDLGAQLSKKRKEAGLGHQHPLELREQEVPSDVHWAVVRRNIYELVNAG
eukprot:7592834-Alexandrium_andersonii.AAC.1